MKHLVVMPGDKVILTVRGNSQVAVVSKVTDKTILVGPLRFDRYGASYGVGIVRSNVYSIRLPSKGEVEKLEAAKAKQLEESRKGIDPTKQLAMKFRRRANDLTLSQLASLGVERLEMMIGFCERARIGANDGNS